MHIAIVGTRGIPNAYGGFEQFAEYLATGLVERGHQVTVYLPDFHAYKEPTYRGVRLKRKPSPERWLGGAANLLYDYACLKDAVCSGEQVMLACGPGATVPTGLMRLGKTLLVTNMDGIEWRRAKWNGAIRRLVRWMEGFATRRSHHLVADNIGIQSFLQEAYGAPSTFIPYGADLVGPLDPGPLAGYGLVPGGYGMLVARLEPENNIEMILDGWCLSASAKPFLVIGNAATPYGAKLRQKYRDAAHIRFIGGIYDKSLLDALRQHAWVYCHGHSVGGTNPSLLEAMACGATIFAHDNPFNRSVLAAGGAAYFHSPEQFAGLLAQGEPLDREHRAEANRARIQSTYTWPAIIDAYERLFLELVASTPADGR